MSTQAETQTKEIVSTDVLDEIFNEEIELFSIVFHNDNTTPFEFVLALLSNILKLSIDESEEAALHVHNNGKAVVFTAEDEIVRTKTSALKRIIDESDFSDFKFSVEKAYKAPQFKKMKR